MVFDAANDGRVVFVNLNNMQGLGSSLESIIAWAWECVLIHNIDGVRLVAYYDTRL
jgi:hypothetical protein